MARMHWSRIERGIYELQYPEDPTRKGGYWGRYKAYGQNKWTGPHTSPSKARSARASAITALRDHRQQFGTVKPTVATVETLILEHLQEIKDIASAYREQARFGAWWITRLGKRPMLSLEPKDVRQAIAALKASGKRNGTVNHYVKFLRHVMRAAVKPKAWVLEFWSDITLLDGRPDQKGAVYTVEQENRLFDQLRPIDLLFCRLDLLLGIRGGQIVSLRWEYCNWETRLLNIPKFKSHPARTIPLVDEAIAILRHLWDRQQQPDRGWIFPSPLKPLVHLDYHNWYNRRFLVAMKAAGLDGLGLTFHGLRRTWATRAANGTPPRVLQIVGGWSDLKMVELYTQPFEQSMREAMERAAAHNSGSANRVLMAESTKKKKLA